MQWFGERGIVLHSAMWDNVITRNYTGADINATTLQTDNATKLCTTMESCGVQPTAPVRKVTPLQFAKTLLPELQPDYVVYNCGHWGGCGHDLYEQLIAATTAALVSHNSRNVIWKSTTVTNKAPLNSEGSASAVFREYNCSVMPAYQLTQALYNATAVHKHPDKRSTSKNYVHNRMFRDGIHYKPPVYRELNTQLLNMLLVLG
jgi:hypothetical protein